MNKILSGKRVYLSSPMSATDSGWNWDDTRWRVKLSLRSIFGLRVFDPYDDPKQDMYDGLKQAVADKDEEGIHSIARHFVKADLGIVDRCDILIAHLPAKIPTTGCVHEIINAYNSKKLVMIVEGEDKFKISSWYRGFIPPQYFFSSWGNLYSRLHEINDGLHKDDDRLWFLYNYPQEWLS